MGRMTTFLLSIKFPSKESRIKCKYVIVKYKKVILCEQDLLV